MALSMRLAPPSACGALLSSASSNAPVFSHPKLSLGKSSFHGTRLVAVPKRRAVSAAPSGAVAVKMMAKREEELKEIRAMSTEEINEQVVDLQGELLVLRIQKSARKEFKPSEFGRMRKRIARLLTVKREREIDEGINKRLSRKLDRKWKKSIVVRPPPSLKKLLEDKAAAAKS